MLLKWEYVCYECQCPLNLTLTIKESKLKLFLRDYGTWCYLRPFSLCKNTSHYKFYDLKVKRVCASCFSNPIRVSLVERESGIKKIYKREERSKTHQEIYEYLSDFMTFRKRKDLGICIVDEDKRYYVCCL
jgi:hypothetical protein